MNKQKEWSKTKERMMALKVLAQLANEPLIVAEQKGAEKK